VGKSGFIRVRALGIFPIIRIMDPMPSGIAEISFGHMIALLKRV
jgi:hypothetical protein